MTKIEDLHRIWSKDAVYRKEYDALAEEFAEMATVAKAWHCAGPGQAQRLPRNEAT